MNYQKDVKRLVVAFDHLCPLGFSKSLIRRTINSLLKVYGDEGWVFLEEDAYKLLIEVILEQDEEPYLVKKNGSVFIAAEEGGGKRWEDLPEDILVHIFSKGLNHPTLCSIEQVCHSWRSACRHHPPFQKRIDAYRRSLIAYNQSIKNLQRHFQNCFLRQSTTGTSKMP